MKTLLILILIILAGLIAYVRYLESMTVFHPSQQLTATPQERGMRFEDIYLRTKDKSLINGWFFKHPRAAATILYFHGNAGNIADRLDKVSALYHLGVNVFIIDYRGYGKSKGKPSEHGIYEDALTAYNYLLTRGDIVQNKIAAYGASLGGAVAVDLASKKPLAGLIIDSSFSSAADMGKSLYPWLPAFLMQTKMDSARKIKTVAIPKLFFHSAEDRVVPIRLGQKLYEAALPPKIFLKINGGHNDNHTVSEEIWIKGIREFLKDLKFL